VRPAWANACVDGTPDNTANGTLTNAKDGNGYFPGCSALAFDSAFTSFPGTCTATSYSIPLTTAINGSILVIITWNSGPNGTPTNQPETHVHTGFVNGTTGETSTCTLDFVAQSGPFAVTLNNFSASARSGGAVSLALAALAAVVAAVAIRRRRWSSPHELDAA